MADTQEKIKTQLPKIYSLDFVECPVFETPIYQN